MITARKREENLQQVPIAVTAFGEVQIDNQYANDIGELSKFTPNVILARQPYAGNALFGGMRGIVFGDLEKSFDPAVGVVIDGVPLVTNTGALIDAFDLESVEVLRGPQGTLYGRNTIAGLVNVRRSRPTKEWGLKMQARYGSFDEIDVKAVANAPIGETIGVKLGVFYDKSDGFTEDAIFDLPSAAITGTGKQTDGEDTINLIASALWEPSENFDALLTYEYTDDDSTLATPTNLTVEGLSRTPLADPIGAPIGFANDWDDVTNRMFCNFLPAGTPCAGFGVPGVSSGGGPGAAIGGAIGQTLGSGGNFCDLYATVFTQLFVNAVRDVACASQGYLRGEANGYKYSYTAVPFVNNIKQHGVTFEMNWDIGEYTLTSVTGYRKSDEILNEDNLGAAVPIFNPVRPQSFDQFSTELRAASSFDGIFNFVAGAYYVQSEYEIRQSIFVFGTQFPSGCPGCALPPAGPSPDGDAGQDLRSVALFGEAYVDLTEKAKLTVGARWTWEEKDFFIFQRVSGDSSGLLPGTWGCGNLSSSQQAAADAALAAHLAIPRTPAQQALVVAGNICNDSDGKETWTEITPRIAIDYSFTEDVLGYVSWSRGFRSGGWNGRATTPTSIGAYNPETVDNYELGLRSDWFENRLRLNLTYFHAKYDNKQESQIYAFGTATETIVDNAAQAIINGIEAETQYLLTDELMLRGAFGWVKGSYDKFEAFNRVTGRIEDVSDIRAFGFAPEFNVNVGFDYRMPLPGEFGELNWLANYSWADGTTGNFGQPDLTGLGRNVFDSRGEADFTLAWEKEGWFRFAAFVKDAFHENNYLATSVDVGVFWFGAVAPGRTWGIELTKEF
ncbi:MAG: TonB-dependent receptor [Deltaproteobacteria bacterium]|nr:TonB-dependent receptor [Deltaproteobacteria bacterium]